MPNWPKTLCCISLRPIFKHLAVGLVALTLLSPVGLQAQVAPSEAASKVRQHTGGKVLRVKMSSDKSHYKVKVLLPGGKVRVVTVDRKSGAIR